MNTEEFARLAKLHEKVAKVQGEMKGLAKSGYNNHSKYAYSTADDVLNPIREACAKVGLSVNMRIVSSELKTAHGFADGQQREYKNKAAFVVVAVRVTDTETGCSDEGASPGYSEDIKGDKAIFQAITGASKYALRSFFCLATDDEPESDYKDEPVPLKTTAYKPPTGARTPTPIRPAVQPKLSPAPLSSTGSEEMVTFAVNELGMSKTEVRDLVRKVLNNPNIVSAKELTKAQVDQVFIRLQELEQVKAKEAEREDPLSYAVAFDPDDDIAL